jgi:hypothetical protein
MTPHTTQDPKPRTILYPILVIVNGMVVKVPAELSASIVKQFVDGQQYAWNVKPFDEWLVERLKDMFLGDGGQTADAIAEGRDK